MKIINIIFILLIFAGCKSKVRSWDKIKGSKVLKVITINSETTRYEDRDGTIKGFEYDLISSFAQSEGLQVKFIISYSVSDALNDLELGKGDIVAAGISVTDSRESRFLYGPQYLTTQQRIVCAGNINPKNLEELQKYEVIVGTDTSYAQRLSKLKEGYRGLSWKEVSDKTTPELIHDVSQGKYECTVADEHIVQIYRRYFPKVNSALKLGSEDAVAWPMPNDATDLKQKVDSWFSTIKSNKLQSLKEKYFSFVKNYDPFDIRKFKERVKSRLPRFKEHLKAAAKRTGWDWTLLAAISYQESHWDPNSKSPTGVRGLMMLTQSTAKYMGVKNRLDPKASIEGGAKYLRYLENRIPHYIRSPDRKWMALASYNIGFAHLRDARGVAAWRNQNPNSWSGVKKVLPLLSSREVYRRLPHGYARGMEPVLYIDRIRNYQDILNRELSRK